MIKAKRKGDAWLADRVYSGVPAGWIGREQEIEIGHMSGMSNVQYYLASRGLDNSHEVAQAVLQAAKRSARVLSEEEILEIVAAQRQE